MDILVINKKTKELVPYRFNEYGEIVLLPMEEEDTEDNCIVVAVEDVVYKNIWKDNILNDEKNT